MIEHGLLEADRPPGPDIPTDWERSVERIEKNRSRKILVLGGVDRGKSTYCGFLLRRLLGAGHYSAALRRISFVAWLMRRTGDSGWQS